MFSKIVSCTSIDDDECSERLSTGIITKHVAIRNAVRNHRWHPRIARPRLLSNEQKQFRMNVFRESEEHLWIELDFLSSIVRGDKS
ncbi:hypothetical protein Trydic_g19012 [Trypoxylus dichotomus]